MAVRDREMPAPMYWSVTIIGFIALALAILTTIALVQEGWDWQTGILAAVLYGASFDFLYASFGPRGQWPTALWFWP